MRTVLIGCVAAVWMGGVALAQHPQVASAATSTTDSNATSHTVTMPSSVGAADTVIVCFSSDGNTNATFPMGWTEIKDVRNGITLTVAWLEGDPGSTITVTTADIEKSAHVSYRITGAADPDTNAPEISTGATGTGNPDPDSLTPAGGSDDYLWIACAAVDQTAPSGPAVPSNFSNLQVITAAGGATVTTLGAEQAATNSVLDPGTFGGTYSSEEYVAVTIAVYPGAGGASGPPIGTLQLLNIGR